MAPKHQNKTLSLFLNISFLILLSFYLKSHYSTPLLTTFTHRNSIPDCTDLSRFQDSESKCAFLRSPEGCKSGGYINYLQLFFCTCGKSLLLGYTVLLVWLLLLFYLLGNTAAYYFCSSLEDLSRVLKLSPAIAGVTLLSLGNGAPDVFASIVSFVRPGSGGVGLNSILGGAFFVSSVVVGVISIGVGKRGISVDKSSFIRDVCFLLLALLSLLAILLVGRINIWGAMAFTSIYFVYVFVISTTHLCREKERVVDLLGEGPLLPINQGFSRCSSGEEETPELEAPLLSSATVKEEPICLEKRCVQTHEKTAETRFLCFDCDQIWYYGKKVLHLVELPLYLPRRLTIPVVSEERWNKVYAVSSVTLAPNLLAALWNSHGEDMGVEANSVIYVSAALIGITLGILASLTTEKSSPPKRFLFPWLAAGFLMSVVWTYMIAEELVGLLVSLGTIVGINPSILGLTVLAWGNSLGDLIANGALAIRDGGSDGTQVAISGCYAGPMFNTLVGLGLSFIISAWRAYPSPYLVPRDPSLYQTLGFLVGGLLWALVILPKKGMKLDKFLGCGLLAIYLCFLSLSLAQSLGWIQFDGNHG